MYDIYVVQMLPILAIVRSDLQANQRRCDIKLNSCMEYAGCDVRGTHE